MPTSWPNLRDLSRPFTVDQTNAFLHEDPTAYGHLERRGHLDASPEHRLVFAILETALHILVTTRPARRKYKDFLEHAAWLADDHITPFSFIWCCHHLNLEHVMQKLRQGVAHRIAVNDKRPILITGRHAPRPRAATSRRHHATGACYHHGLCSKAPIQTSFY